MNLAYYRKSSFSKEMTLSNIKKESEKLGFQMLSKEELNNGKIAVINVCNRQWMSNLIASDKNLISLLPCSVVVIENNNEVLVGAGNPSILGSVSGNPAVKEISVKAEIAMKDLINKVAGVESMKPLKIKLYSTMSCPYCKMEAAWLNSKKVNFEEVHVDLNQKEAEEMVSRTGQMGVPVTAVLYDNGDEEFIVGFDKPKLESILEVS